MAAADYRLMTEATGQRIAIALENVSAMVGPKGDTGEVSEAELTAKLADKADVILDTASGAIASIPDGMAAPAKDVIIGIEPVQDLHGYDNPWPAGGGKNKIDNSTNVVGGYYDGTGRWTSDLNVATTALIPVKASTQYTTSMFTANGVYIDGCVVTLWDDENTCTEQIITQTFTTGASTQFVRVRNFASKGSYVTGNNYKYQIEEGGSHTSYSPYSNICPISGWTGANVVVSPTTSAQDGTTYPISWQSEAGTVYGGTLDVTTGLLTVDRATVTFDANLSTGDFGMNALPNATQIAWTAYPSIGITKDVFVCDTLTYKSIDTNAPLTICGAVSVPRMFLYLPTSVTKKTEAVEWFADHPTTVVYHIATPITYQLSPTEVTLLLGDNNVWADTGDSTVAYRADTKLYIQKINTPTDDDMIADAQIASGKYFIIGGNLYRSTTTIPAGDTITPGSNCILTNLADALNALNT